MPELSFSPSNTTALTSDQKLPTFWDIVESRWHEMNGSSQEFSWCRRALRLHTTYLQKSIKYGMQPMNVAMFLYWRMMAGLLCVLRLDMKTQREEACAWRGSSSVVSVAIRTQKLDHPEESCNWLDDVRSFTIGVQTSHALLGLEDSYDNMWLSWEDFLVREQVVVLDLDIMMRHWMST